VTEPNVHLIDASPYIFRAWFSLPEMTDPQGRPVSAVRGFAEFLLRYLVEQAPSHLACTFDESLTTSFRNDLYPPYKAQRELPPPELEAQLAGCQAVARALHVPVFSDDRYEADDLIATLARPAVEAGARVVVVSSDKDLAQLVGPRLELFDFAKDTRLGPDGVKAKFGVTPGQIPDYLGLAGDAVDNIPGVKGVGAKTAVALLDAFADLDELYASLERVAQVEVRGARTLAAKLEACRELAFLSRELATVAYDAPAQATLEQLRWEGVPRSAREVFEHYGISRLLDRVKTWKDQA
jgi:5'-3' exonuclease